LVWRLRLFGRNAGFVDKDIETRTALPAEQMQNSLTRRSITTR